MFFVSSFFYPDVLYVSCCAKLCVWRCVTFDILLLVCFAFWLVIYDVEVLYQLLLHSICILPVCIISGAGPGRSVSIKSLYFFFFIIYFIHTIIFIHRISSAYTTTSTGISTRTQNSICIHYINTAALLFIFVLSHGARNTLCNCRSVARSLRLS